MRDENQDGDLEQPVTPDVPPSDVPAETSDSEDVEYPVDRLRQRLNQRLGGRPLIVYLVLLAGGATLLLLIIIVWISASGPGRENRPICTTISPGEAQRAILDGDVQRIDVLVDKQDPLHSLTGMNIEFVDGTCRQLPQGADARDQLYFILGVTDFYNRFGEQRVKVTYQQQDIPRELLATSTPTPTATIPPTETPTPEPTATSTPPPTPTATNVVVAPASPEAISPEAGGPRTLTASPTTSATP